MEILQTYTLILALVFLTALLYNKIDTRTLQVNFHVYNINPELQKAIRSKNTQKSPLNADFISNYIKQFLLENEITITRSVNSRNPRCRPNCKNRKNIIYLNNQGTAGLSDRISILYHVNNLASYLCANIIVDKPCKLLDVKEHGKGVPVSCDLNWSDFKQFKRYSNSGMEPDDMILTNKQITPPKVQLKAFNSENFEKAVSLFENNIQFSWETDRNYYLWRNQLQEYFTEHLRPENTSYPVINSWTQVQDQLECISPIRYSKIVISLAEKVMIKSGINSEFGTLHIRRGDAIRECNTAINHVKDYLECSLKKCNGDFPVIFFTDEPSQRYSKKVSDLLSSLNHKMINGEKLIKSVLEIEILNGRLSKSFNNNFFQFEISNLIKEISRYQMVQRRKRMCNNCDPMCVDRKRRKRDLWSNQENFYYLSL